MSLLPPALARELVEQLYESKIEALPGLRGLPAEVRAALCMSMKPIKVRPNHRSAVQQGALRPNLSGACCWNAGAEDGRDLPRG